ncbi:gluconokinase [Alphaproteobacteria bacterium]|nr:gluconokinase [Alphaproteobacteria bacterium]
MIVIIMGVSGCGKSTIGKKLAQKLGCSFLEGDDFHPTENITKMKKGIPLTDQDRLPWLKKISEKCAHENNIGNNLVVACSALKKQYRLILHNAHNYELVHLFGDLKTIKQRMSKRDHFMPIKLIESQFETLEPPTKEEDAIATEINLPIEALVDKIALELTNRQPRLK